MGRRSRSISEVQIEEYRNNAILLDKGSSKFVVQEIAEIAPVDTVQEARNAIDRHINEGNKGVRRKVLFFGGDTWDSDKARRIVEGELTSWTRGGGYRSVQGVVVYGPKGRSSRENMNPDDIFESTPENRATMEKVIALERRKLAIQREAKKLEEHELERAKMPAHFEDPQG